MMISLPGLTCGVRFRCFRVAIRLKSVMSIDWAGFDHNGYFELYGTWCHLFWFCWVGLLSLVRAIRLYIYRREPHSLWFARYLKAISTLLFNSFGMVIETCRTLKQQLDEQDKESSRPQLLVYVVALVWVNFASWGFMS